MLATAIQELNQSTLPARLFTDPDRPASMRCQWGETADFEAFVWGSPRQRNGQVFDVNALCEAARAHWNQISEHLRGSFAVLVVDKQNRRVQLISDRFCTRRLYFTVLDGQLWVSESLKELCRRLPEKPSIDPQAVVNYLYFHMIPGPETFYQAISVTSPAEVIQLVDGQLTKRRHWMPNFNDTSGADADTLAKDLFDLLAKAVSREAEQPASGCFLSGGLDSSSIAGLVGRVQPGAAAFSIGFPVEQYNELEYARCAVEHFGLTGHEYTMHPEDVVDALPQVVASMDQPFGNSSVLPAYFCAKMAKDQGVDRLIAGDGGDELFAGNERYSHQLKLDGWRNKLGPMVSVLDGLLLKPKWPDQPALLRKAKSFTRQLRMTVPENLEYYNFLNLIDRKTIFSDSLQAEVDLLAPDQRCQTLFDEPESASTLDRMLYMDWKHTLADNDLIKVSTMCQLAGVEVVYPMLDDDLVDFSLKIPASLKLTPSNLRHLYKLSMTGFLPEKIIHKQKHGFGLPFGVWTKDHPELQALAYAAVDNLKAYDLFQPDFLDEVKRLHQHEHAKHYGELVWVLMILSLWLDENA